MTAVTKYTCQITTSDPITNTVGFVLKGDATERQALINTVPVAFRWPEAGETWMVRQENGTWYLDGPLMTSSYLDQNPGDAIVNAPTGVIQVLGSADGSTDFSFSKTSPKYLAPVVAPSTPATGFVLYVDTADGKLKAKNASGIVTILAS